MRDGDDAIEYEVPTGYLEASAVRVSLRGRSRTASGSPAVVGDAVMIPGPSPEVLRVQELLADLGYLPLDFSSAMPVQRTESAELASFSDPPSGIFRWRWSGLPRSLRTLWHPGTYGAMTQGAVMTFERAHAMVVDSSLTSTLLDSLAEARESATDPDPDAYSYVLVREGKPETLTLYVDGRAVLRSLANTGLDASTPLGSWPIYLREPSQTLVGTYPNGEPYDIPDVRDIDYFDGNFAVHELPRASYGFPQSAGCVEIPPAADARLWERVSYGTLVTVAA